MARQRRFAGQLPQFGAATPDILEAAQETIKTAGQFLKPSRGGRLGASSAEEQAEGAAARLANPQVFNPTNVGATNPLQDVAKLRKDLGIDDLISSISQLRSQQTGGGAGAGMGQELPDLTFPEFQMPEFEIPDFGAMMPEERYAPTQEAGGTEEQPTQAIPKKKGISSYNLKRFGGAGLGGRDVKALLSRGATPAQLQKIARQAPKVSASGAAQLKQAGVQTSSATKKASGLSTAGAKAIAKAKAEKKGATRK